MLKLKPPPVLHRVAKRPKRMSWTCHGATMMEMVKALTRANIIKSTRVADAMNAVDRGLFVQENPYIDSPQPIGANATISAPHMHAYALELMEEQLQPGARVLDVGSGTGYLTACMAYLIKGDPSARAVGVEHVPELVSRSLASVQQIPWAKQLLDAGQLVLEQGDGRDGYPQHAPYNAIHVGAAAPRVPAALTQQLAPGGRLVIPVGPEHGAQHLLLVDKALDGSLTQTVAMGVQYVPLTSLAHQVTRF